MYLINYTLTVQFLKYDYTRQPHNNNLLNMKSKPFVNWLKVYISLNFYQKIRKIWTKVIQQQNTVCLEHQIYTSPNILHQRCCWCWRHLESLPSGGSLSHGTNTAETAVSALSVVWVLLSIARGRVKRHWYHMISACPQLLSEHRQKQPNLNSYLPPRDGTVAQTILKKQKEQFEWSLMSCPWSVY